jgi:rare lipoprotein A
MRKLCIVLALFLSFKGVAQKNEAIGTASYYHHKFHGRKTATGEKFDINGMTAASNSLPLGTLVKVTNLKNGNTVIVKINDRMNAKNKRLIDLSFQAAKELDFIKSGTCKVKVVKVSQLQYDTDKNQ